MTTHHPPRLALSLLERLVPNGAAIAGDLTEDYQRHRSHWRVWCEVAAAISLAWRERGDEIRPLRLVDLQPSDALERTRRFELRFKSPSLAASPLAGIGGLTTVVLAALMTVVAPGAWWLLAFALLAGIALGASMIAARRRRVE